MTAAMQVFSHGATVAPALRGGVVALGNFDGFHAGHQAVVGQARDRARVLGVPALVATFDPHPATLFRPDAPPFALTTLAQKAALFAAFGIDAMVVIPFDARFAAQSAEAFVHDWLGDYIGAVGAVTGADFTFGQGRAGTTDSLRDLGAAHGIAAEVVSPVSDGVGITSSSRIRDHLRAGDPAAAAALLTRPFTLAGPVEHGAKLGRTLGFPTANITLGDYLRPRFGVYAVRAALPDGRKVDGVANLGIRPMITPPVELLETFLFDWSGDLYGQVLGIELVAFLRPEWQLDGLAALQHQIAADCDAARRALAG